MSEVTHYPELHCFQVDIGGLEADYISYTEHNGGWDVNHTEASPNFRHHGTAKLLVNALMEYAETHRIPLAASRGCVTQFIG